MKKKLMIISAAGLLALSGLAVISGTIGSGNMSITKAAAAHEDHGDSDGTERAFYAPGTYTHVNENGETVTDETGSIPYWRCNACCSSDANSARYDLKDHNKALTLADVQIPALTKATKSDIAEGDEIANVNLGKFKYVDQGANGVDGKEGTSTPWYIKDSGKTAIYFSRSGKTGAHDGKNVEFRFTTASSSVKSVTFSYRLKNWGTGTATDTVEYTSLCQFISDNAGSNRYESIALDSKIQNDDAWHTVTVNYSDYNSSASVRTEFTGFLLKFADLRGYVMISGLSYETTKDVTLKNVNADGTDKTETVSIGSLPTAPTMDGKKFLGWYDESGNKVTSVDGSTSTLIARWGVIGAESDYSIAETVKAFNTDSGIVCPDATAVNERDDGVAYDLQKEGVTSFDIALPAFDYNTAGRVDFVLKNPYGPDPWGTIKAGSGSFAYSTIKAEVAHAYIISDGTNASFYVEGSLLTTYDADVSSGKAGLTFTFVRQSFNTYMRLTIGDFKQYTLDYTAQLSAKTAALPDSVTDDNKAAAVTAYKEYARAYSDAHANMTAYEKANYAEPSKVSSLKTSLAGETTEVLSIPSSGDGWSTANSLGIYSDANNFGVSFSTNSKNNVNCICINLQDGGYSATKTYYVDLPKINYSAYSKITFKMFSGTASKGCNIKADGKDWVSGVQWENSDWPSAITISTTEGVTKIASDNGSSAILSDEVAKGTKALRFERTREVTDSSTGYDTIGFSSLVATI